MLSAAVVVLAAAPLALADLASAPAEAVTPAAAADRFEFCEQKLGQGQTHSLLDIVMQQAEQGGQGAASEGTPFEDLLANTGTETMALLDSFDVSMEGYTLLMPAAMSTNYSGDGNNMVDTFELFGIDVNMTTMEEADDIVKAHLVKGTLDFNTINMNVEDEDYVVESALPGWNWTFTLVNGTEGGFPAIKDVWNVTDSPDGTIKTQFDVRIEPDCPNVVIIVEFIATPELIAELAPAPEPVEASAPTPTTARTPDEPLFPEEPDAPMGGEFTNEPTPGGQTPAAADGIQSRGLLAASVAGAVALAAAMI